MALLDTPLCDFGAAAPEFSLAEPDGRVHTLADVAGPNGLLVAFVCNHCPYVVAVADRLATDAAELQANGIGVVAIMSNDYRDYAADNPDNMRAFAAKYGWTFPYLVDEEQSIGQAYGAICTPDFFGYNAALELQYRGRLDDAGMRDPEGRTRELVNAMLEVGKTGNGPREQSPSMGCSIKWRS
jgi:peroxiredoxin